MNGKISVYAHICTVITVIIMCVGLASCTSGRRNSNDTSLVMIKNAGMSTYGTGFAVGVPGKGADTIVTAYSVVATANGAAPKNAGVRIKDSEREILANIIYYDTEKNLALLRLSEPQENLKPVLLKEGIKDSETVYARGYDGTGNIMSDFEKFNSTDIVQYIGNIIDSSTMHSMDIYKFSNEFNRALIGAPAVDKNGYGIGMCAYSVTSMNTFSQYILPAEEIIKTLSGIDFEFMTYSEYRYRNIIFSSVIMGMIVLLAIICLYALLIKYENNLACKDNYIVITDGALKGKKFKFEDKLTIGTNAEKCDVVYPQGEKGISRVHCTLQMYENECYLVDNFSSYGTYLVNKGRIDSSFPHKIEKRQTVFYLAEPKNRVEFYFSCIPKESENKQNG